MNFMPSAFLLSHTDYTNFTEAASKECSQLKERKVFMIIRGPFTVIHVK